MSISLDAELLSKLLNHLTKMIKSRQGMIDWLKEFIDDIRTQEIAVNSTKTGAAVLGVVSAIGLFTPFAPLAVAGIVAAGGAGVATTIGDLIANKVKGGNLETKVDNMKAEDSKLQDLQRKVDEQARILAEVTIKTTMELNSLSFFSLTSLLSPGQTRMRVDESLGQLSPTVIN